MIQDFEFEFFEVLLFVNDNRQQCSSSPNSPCRIFFSSLLTEQIVFSDYSYIYIISHLVLSPLDAIVVMKIVFHLALNILLYFQRIILLDLLICRGGIIC